MLDSKHIAQHTARLVHAPVRVYNNYGERLFYVGNGENLEDPLLADADFEKMLVAKGNTELPILYFENDMILYSVIKGEEITFVTGPCCAMSDTTAAQRYIVKRHGLDPAKGYKITTSITENLYETSLMLFSFVSDTAITREEMLSRNYNIDVFNKKVEKNAMEVYDNYLENNLVHNPYSQERREQDSIKNGDREALKAAIDEVYVGELGKMAKNELRSFKNIALTVLALASRSAIEGGLLPEVAFSLSDAYSMHIEELNNPSEIEAFLRSAEYQLTDYVHKIKTSNKQNPIVIGAKDYVLKHLNRKISLNDLAQALSVNPSYLSDLFSSQEGMTLSNYILREKINAAKRQLIFTDDSYGEIAYNYGFSSQSHFGKVFKKFTEMTPKDFRKLNKISEIQP